MFRLIVILFTISNAQASIELRSGRTTKKPVIDKRTFFKVINFMEEEFQYLAREKNEELVIFGGWVEPTADMAFARRWEDAQVLIYRGMAHRREINPDALILIICHELGHLYGGEPFKRPDNHISPEGQADYFATSTCLKKALMGWSTTQVKERTLTAILNVALFLANNRNQQMPSEETPDTSEVVTTNMRHPSPQCRLDTYFAGLRNNDRPRCWYYPFQY